MGRKQIYIPDKSHRFICVVTNIGKGLYINDVMLFRGGLDSSPPLIIGNHFLADPPFPLIVENHFLTDPPSPLIM